MEISQVIELLKKTGHFAVLTGEELAELAGMAKEKRCENGQTIFWEGDTPDWIYVVGEGKVKIAKYASSGKELIVAIFTSGQIFGEVAVFDGIPYPASAQAIGQTTILGIRRDDLLSFLSRNPGVALRMINLLGSRLREAHDRLRDMAGERVDQRVARILLMISGKTGMHIPFTRQEIADMAGTTTETAFRVTTRMKEQGIIDTVRGGINIIDITKLSELSEGLSL